ncbi:MAG: carboxypeptidase regulatory-like domain-containing protein [Candidatus Hydrogenedentes bacterium]|nr:carboxypeptidase regulatory-like domain-containing protein [Candidatus Hydrogenedentota bacterium]
MIDTLAGAAPYQLIARVWTRSGEPVPDAEIVCTPTNTEKIVADGEEPIVYRFRTGADGRAVQDFGGESTSYWARCERDGLLAAGNVRFGGHPVNHLDLVLRPPAALKGRTVDALGKPVPEVTVHCSLERSGKVASVESGPDGVFEFTDLPYDSISKGYLLRGEAPGYVPTISELVRPGDDVDLVMSRGARVVISVRRKADGRPLPGVQVSATRPDVRGQSFEGVSDATGIINLEGLTPASYTVTAKGEKYVLDPFMTRVEVQSGLETRLELLATDAAAIAGRVVDAVTEAGVPGVEVWAFPTGEASTLTIRATSDPTGGFLLTGLKSGTHQIGLLNLPARYGGSRGSISNFQDVHVDAGGERDDVVFEITPGLVLSGHVVYEDGAPAGGATVQAHVYHPTAGEQAPIWVERGYTDSNGAFVIARPPENKPVHVEAWLRTNKSPVVGPIPSDSPAAQHIEVVLPPPPETTTVAGHVVDERGAPVVAQVSAHRRGPDPITDQAQTDMEGHFLLTDILPGAYDFTLRNTGMDTDGPDVEAGSANIQAGRRLENLRLVYRTSGLTISGVVYDQNNATVHAYRVQLARGSGDGVGFKPLYSECTTDRGGRFRFENLEPGVYRLSGDRSHGRWQQVVQPGDDVSIVLPPKEAPDEN